MRWDYMDLDIQSIPFSYTDCPMRENVLTLSYPGLIMKCNLRLHWLLNKLKAEQYLYFPLNVYWVVRIKGLSYTK